MLEGFGESQVTDMGAIDVILAVGAAENAVVEGMEFVRVRSLRAPVSLEVGIGFVTMVTVFLHCSTGSSGRFSSVDTDGTDGVLEERA